MKNYFLEMRQIELMINIFVNINILSNTLLLIPHTLENGMKNEK